MLLSFLLFFFLSLGRIERQEWTELGISLLPLRSPKGTGVRYSLLLGQFGPIILQQVRPWLTSFPRVLTCLVKNSMFWLI